MIGIFLVGMVAGALLTIGLLKLTASEGPMGCIAVVSILSLLVISTLIVLSETLV